MSQPKTIKTQLKKIGIFSDLSVEEASFVTSRLGRRHDQECRPHHGRGDPHRRWPLLRMAWCRILKNYDYPFPNLLILHDAPKVIEQKLFVMYLEHRMRVFQGTFHGSPDNALWYGWNEMRRDLTGIKELAETMREIGQRPKTQSKRQRCELLGSVLPSSS